MNNDVFYPWLAPEATRMKWIWTEPRMFGLLRLGLDPIYNTYFKLLCFIFLNKCKIVFLLII
jgi:hypothetical protein